MEVVTCKECRNPCHHVPLFLSGAPVICRTCFYGRIRSQSVPRAQAVTMWDHDTKETMREEVILQAAE